MNTGLAGSIERNLAAALDYWAATRPDHIALVCDTRRWTWAELARDVRRLSSALTWAGLRPGGRFAHIDRNDPASVLATLAAAYGGFVHVAVNWRLGHEELVYVLGHSESEIILTGADFTEATRAAAAELPGVRLMVVVGGQADTFTEFLANGSIDAPAYTAAGPDEGVLQLYTSGTTGRPKGAVLTHRSLGDNALGQAAAQGLNPDATHVVPMPMFHIGGQSMLTCCLAGGARLVLARSAEPAALIELVRAERATHVFLVPTAVQMLLDAEGATVENLGSLRCLLYSGAPMPGSVLEHALRTFGDRLAVHGGYGMTEISGMICSLPPADHLDPAHPDRLGTVGKVIDRLDWRVVDADSGLPVGVGARGELQVRSPSVMREYFRDPAATAAAVVDGWLRTGDLVTYDADGYIRVAGRLKEVIISGGENIAPAEVERVVLGAPGVREAFAYGIPDNKFGEVVALAVIPEPGAALTAGAVRAYTEQHLGRFKIPRVVEIVDDVPRTPTGKVQRHALRNHYIDSTGRRSIP